MPDLLIDPFLISVPEHPNPTDATRFVERAVIWPIVAQDLGFRIVVSDDYATSLYADGSYPTFSGIQALCSTSDSHLYDAHTVFRSLEGILARAPNIQRILEVNKVLLADDERFVDPDAICERLSQQLSESLQEALALCGLHTQISNQAYPFALLTELPAAVIHTVLNGEFSVLVAEFNNDAAVNLPIKVPIQCAIVRSEENLFESVDFLAVSEHPQLAIEWSWRRAILESERAIHKLTSFSVRTEFMHRVEELHISLADNEMIFQKLACLICGRPLPGSQVHALRTGSGGGNPQRIRESDGASAWRVTIKRHGAGLRVHYWDCPDGSIEIAWLGPHSDLNIPE